MVTWLLTNLCTHILQVYLCVFTFDIDFWVSGCIEYACIWYWSPRFSHEMNVFTNKTKKCVHKICMNITQLNVHSVMFTWRKKKSSCLIIISQSILVLKIQKFIVWNLSKKPKQKPKYFQPMKFPLKIKEILWSQSSKFHNWNREIIII